MLPRYVSTKMSELWSEEYRLEIWLKVEILVCEALVENMVVPPEVLCELKTKAKIDKDSMRVWENKTHHDVVAFLWAVSETVSEESAKWLHYGLTSTDLVDTSLGYFLKQANKYLLQDMKELLKVLRHLALTYRETITLGRTHGMYAEPVTLGWKFARWYAEIMRHVDRFEQSAQEVEVGKLSGAVGTYSTIDPSVELYVCHKLGLQPASLVTQTITRDRYAQYIANLALIATSIETFATEIRHLQRSEVDEMAESFGRDQTGSSAMPHKRNPIGCENLCGLARMMRSYIAPAYENMVLWHERDISHSSVERIIMPDATQLLDYILSRFTDILKNLVINETKMAQRLFDANGEPFSHNLLLALIRKGWSRIKAYNLVRSLSKCSRERQAPFRLLVEENDDIRRTLTESEREACFDIKEHLKHMDKLFVKAGLFTN